MTPSDFTNFEQITALLRQQWFQDWLTKSDSKRRCITRYDVLKQLMIELKKNNKGHGMIKGYT